MKKFTINCDFGGQMAPFAIYIGKPEKKHHPLHFQADWLSKQRGGMIPSEVMDAVGQLQELAEKNGVSLEELCVYALGTDEEKQETEEKSLSSDDESQVNASAPMDIDDSEQDMLDEDQLEEDIDADADYVDEFLIPDEGEIPEYEDDDLDDDDDDEDDDFDDDDFDELEAEEDMASEGGHVEEDMFNSRKDTMSSEDDMASKEGNVEDDIVEKSPEDKK